MAGLGKTGKGGISNGVSNLNKELRDLVKSIKAYMELEKEAGVSEIPSSVKDREPLILKTSGKELEEFEFELLSCKKCQLHKSRTNLVFGSGNPKADLVFIGEAPGYEEDLQGLPFVGRAGVLLTKIIEAMGFGRKDVYIANILKCRPPENRNPLPTEILACEEHIVHQLDIIKPRVICTLGKFATQTLLRTQESITKLRGNFYGYRGIKVMPTFHPAYLLRNPQDKKLVWQDVKKIMAELRKNS